MNKTMILVAAGLLAAGAASAQQARGLSASGAVSPWYGELGYTHLDIESRAAGGSFNANPGAVRGIVGYDVHPNLAVEGMLAFGARSDDTSGVTLGVPFSGDVKLRHSIGAFARPKAVLGPLEVFARLGVAQTKVRTQVSAGGAPAAATDSKSDFAWGGGLNWQFTPRAYLGLDLMRYYDVGGTKVDGTTLSVGTRW